MNLGGSYELLAEYVRTTADEMGLRDWTFEVSEEPVMGDAGDPEQMIGASCNVAYGRKRARLKLSPDWAEEPPHNLRYLVVHELVHCHFVPVQWHHNNVRSAMSHGEWTQFDSSFLDVMEMHVDAVSAAWSRNLPLPPVEESE